jgi:hypothetical protein
MTGTCVNHRVEQLILMALRRLISQLRPGWILVRHGPTRVEVVADCRRARRDVYSRLVLWARVEALGEDSPWRDTLDP